jgi:hypothetical protein
MRARTAALPLLPVLLLLLQGPAARGGDFGGDYSKISGIIIPGFASTQLRAWSVLDCPYTPLDFNPLDLVWLDTTKVSNAFCCCVSILAELKKKNGVKEETSTFVVDVLLQIDITYSKKKENREFVHLN